MGTANGQATCDRVDNAAAAGSSLTCRRIDLFIFLLFALDKRTCPADEYCTWHLTRPSAGESLSMPALPPYIPPRDTDFNSWFLNFSTLLTASPATYGMVAGDASAVAAAYADWAAAYALAIAGTTRGPMTIAAKDDARTADTAIVRPYAVTISLNAGVMTSDKVAIGVNPRTSLPSPIAAPATNPVISIVAALPLVHSIRYRDMLSSPSVKSKPYGVVQCQIFGATSITPITDQTDLNYLAGATKCPLTIEWSADDSGKQAYYAARWINRNGLVGPWSPIVSMTVANGST